MAKVEKLPSGNYRVRKMVDGRSVSLTFEKYPKDSDIIKALSKKLNEEPKEVKKNTFTFKDALTDYIELKKDSVSEKYALELSKLPDKLSDEFVNCEITQITQLMLDKEIHKWQKDGKSPKTIKNLTSAVRSVLRKYRPEAYFNTDMCKPVPIVQDEDIYIPSPEEVDELLEYFSIHFPDQYCAFALTTYGLRRSELCALSVSDFDEDCQVHINKAMVENSIHEYYIRPYPKNVHSVRTVPINEELVAEIRAQGFVYNRKPNRLGDALSTAQKALGIEPFSLHKMRHYFASQMHAAGVPDADIKRLLGHQKGSNCLDIVYKHSQIDRNKARKKEIVSSVIDKHFAKRKTAKELVNP